jgi:hypothetical protein
LEQLLGLAALVLFATLTAVIAIRQPAVALPLCAAFLVRAAMALVDFYVSPLPGSQGDAVLFMELARESAAHGMHGLAGSFAPGAFLYSWVLAVFFAVLEPSKLLAQALNVMLGTQAVLLTYRIALEFSGRHDLARRSAWAVCLFPTLILYSAITLRESLIIVLILLGVQHALRWAATDRVSQFAKAVLFLIGGVMFHTGIVSLLFALGLFATWRTIGNMARGRAASLLVGGIGLVLLGGFVFVLYVTEWGLDKVATVMDSGVAEIGQAQSLKARERAAYLEDMVIDEPSDLAWQTPIRVVYFLAMPFPWLISGFTDVIGFLDSVFYLALLGLVWRSRRYLASTEAGRLLTLFLACGIAMFALGTSNYGTAMRHRAKFLALLTILAAVAAGARARERKPSSMTGQEIAAGKMPVRTGLQP